MDISMPNMDGIEATQQIRSKQGLHGRVPVVALTANTLSEDVDRFIAAGMDGFLSKPIRKTALLSKVEEFSATPAVLHELTQTPDGKGNVMIDEKVFSELAEEMPPELIPQILQQFLMELQDRLRTLQQAMTDRDEASFKKVCHSISGSSATIGGMALAGLAKELEMLCAREQGAAALERFGDLAALASQTETAIKELLHKYPADKMVA
jgi:CheY-like chemotaxis protein